MHATRRLLAKNLSLEDIRARLARLTDDELARFVHPEPVVKVADVVVVDRQPSDGPGSTATIASAAPASAPIEIEIEIDAGPAVERWDHISLLPGLELLVRGDSGALVRRIAQEIQERYGVGKS